MKAPSLIAACCLCTAVAFGQSADRIFEYRGQIIFNPRNSLAHYNLAQIYTSQKDYQAAANEFREALNGELQPRWVEVWSHLGLAKIFDITGQRDRAVNEYKQAIKTGDNTDGAQAVAAAYLKQDPDAQDPPQTSPAVLHAPIASSGPAPIQSTEPEYSEEARAAGLEGTVFVRTAISADGTPFDLEIISHLGFDLDEAAIEAVKQWRFAPPPAAQLPSATVAVNFLLPSKLSRWHLVDASFEPPEGVSRPVFVTEPYPLGAGISGQAIDEGWVIAAIPRAATVTLLFDVDEHGHPANFQVLAASAPMWGNEAIAVVRQWRFKSGSKDGRAVAVPCTLDLVWSQKVWTPAILAQLRGKLSVTAANPSQPVASPESAKPTITRAYRIDNDGPHWPYSVVVSATIGQNGVPANVSLVRSLGADYDSKAIEAVRQWRFSLVNGKPAATTITIELDF